MKSVSAIFTLCVATCIQLGAADPQPRREWSVEGATREGLVFVPPTAKTTATPVVFAFHGHGGTMQNAARSFAYQKVWPEALVVYLQGLNTPGKLSDPEGKKPGWQHAAGDQGDRDLKFFDVVLATLRKEFRVDNQRIYAAGHSNGGAFTYLLWAVRGEPFAAFAPSGSAAPRLLSGLKPKPMLHAAGENDPLVKFAWQEMTIAAVRKLNQCGAGQANGARLTTYPSSIGAPVATFIHPGGHQFPAEAPDAIVKFFKEQTKP